LKASVERQVEVFSMAVARGGGPGAAAAATGTAKGVLTEAHMRVERLFEQVVDGFHDVVDGFPSMPSDGESPGGLDDAPLMMRIGILLGLVYLGFLTAWFWATRRTEDELP
jgi:hypothetical protein